MNRTDILTAVYSALSRIADDDIRHDATLAALAEWERHPDKSIEHLAVSGLRRARRDSWRRAVHPATPIASSAAVEPAPARMPRLSPEERLDWQDRRQSMTDRQRQIVDMLAEGYRQGEIADRLGVSQQAVSKAVRVIAAQ